MIKTINDFEINQAKKVCDAHLVKNISTKIEQAELLETLLFSIATPKTSWETASNFIYELRRLSYPKDKDYKNKISELNILTNMEFIRIAENESGLGFKKQNRFNSAVEFFNKTNINPENIISANPETRELYVKQISFLGYKTFSLWHYCLGGKNLSILDIHFLRGLSNLGISIPSNYINTIKNQNKRPYIIAPSKKDYLRIENNAKSFFSKDKRFLIGENKVDLALAHSVLWWKGAKKDSQLYLFSELEPYNYSPYAKR